MRNAMIVVVALLLSTSALAQDNAETRMEAALRYDAVVPFNELMLTTAQQLKQALPADQAQDFEALMTAIVNEGRLRQYYMEQLTVTFTTAELNALADFYGSEEGQSIMRKFPEFMSVTMPYVQQEILRAVSERR